MSLQSLAYPSIMTSIPSSSLIPHWSTVFWLVPTLLLARSAFKLLLGLLQPLSSGLKHIPGPKSKSFLWGHLKEVFQATGMDLQTGWIEKYGHVLRYRATFGVRHTYRRRLATHDHLLCIAIHRNIASTLLIRERVLTSWRMLPNFPNPRI